MLKNSIYIKNEKLFKGVETRLISGESVFREHVILREKTTKLEWQELSRIEKIKSLKTALGYHKKQSDEGDVTLKYAKKLIEIYKSIDSLLLKLEISKINYEKIDFNILRLIGLLLIELEYIEEDIRPKNHLHPATFENIIKILDKKRLDLKLKDFFELYKEMIDCWSNKPDYF